jgi:hypothetical protein
MKEASRNANIEKNGTKIWMVREDSDKNLIHALT